MSSGPISCAVPSSICTRMRPRTTKPRCWSWQLIVPANGRMCSDHRQPGSAIVLAIVTSPRVTMSALPFSKTRESSGLRNVLTPIPGMASSRASGHVERLVASLRPRRAKRYIRVMGSGVADGEGYADRKSSIAWRNAARSSTNGKWLAPGITMSLAPGMRSAMNFPNSQGIGSASPRDRCQDVPQSRRAGCG